MMKGEFFKEGFMNAFRMVMYGIVAAGLMLASSGCHEWHRHGDHDGYDRDRSSYDRNDRRWDGVAYRDRRYARPDRRESWDRD
jgi:hypothetical protein